MAEHCDVLVVGSGSAGCTAALRAARNGLKVIVAEKTNLLGGTSAMSGAGIWIPANHIGAKAGIEDNKADALTYVRAVLPADWADTEDELWQAFIEHAPEMLKFVEVNTPLDLLLAEQPDPYVEAPGGRLRGRMLSPAPLRRSLIGRFAGNVRPSTLKHLFTYQEVIGLDVYHHPIPVLMRLAPKFLWRWATRAGAQGTALMIGLVKGCLDAGVDFRLETRATQLKQDAEGRVTGAVVTRQGKDIEIVASRGVLIASGGFEWDEQLRAKYFPGPTDRIGSPRANDGDGLKMAAAAGAALDRMDQANIWPCLPTVYEGRPHGMPATYQAEPHSIIVDRHARRFVSETDINLGQFLDERDANGQAARLPCYLIGDHRFLKTSLPFRWYASYEKEWVKKAGSLKELASKLDLPAGDLEETVARWNRFCANGHDEDFHRGESAWEVYKAHGAKNRLKPIDKPPYIGMSMNRSILGTKGGARTNAKAQVLRPDGTVIPGLYAAGLAMANPFGTRSVGAGTTIGPNMTWGFIAADAMTATGKNPA